MGSCPLPAAAAVASCWECCASCSQALNPASSTFSFFPSADAGAAAPGGAARTGTRAACAAAGTARAQATTMTASPWPSTAPSGSSTRRPSARGAPPPGRAAAAAAAAGAGAGAAVAKQRRRGRPSVDAIQLPPRRPCLLTFSLPATEFLVIPLYSLPLSSSCLQVQSNWLKLALNNRPGFGDQSTSEGRCEQERGGFARAIGR